LCPGLHPLSAREIHLIVFITHPAPIRKILTHLGEPLAPPPISPARGPPTGWGELVQVHDDRDIVQGRIVERPELDFRETPTLRLGEQWPQPCRQISECFRDTLGRLFLRSVAKRENRDVEFVLKAAKVAAPGRGAFQVVFDRGFMEQAPCRIRAPKRVGCPTEGQNQRRQGQNKRISKTSCHWCAPAITSIADPIAAPRQASVRLHSAGTSSHF